MNESPLLWRVQRLEEDVRELQRNHPDVIAERMRQLGERVDTMTKAFVTLCVSILVATVSVAVTILVSKP